MKITKKELVKLIKEQANKNPKRFEDEFENIIQHNFRHIRNVAETFLRTVKKEAGERMTKDYVKHIENALENIKNWKTL